MRLRAIHAREGNETGTVLEIYLSVVPGTLGHFVTLSDVPCIGDDKGILAALLATVSQSKINWTFKRTVHRSRRQRKAEMKSSSLVFTTKRPIQWFSHK